MKKFSRILPKDIPRLKYDPDSSKNKDYIDNLIFNCHWGALKLFYSEIEFFVKISKYIDISKSLIVYIGAAPGFRIKSLYIKHFFPNLKFLLYDPRPFDIDEDENIIIKTNKEGWFNDDKIDEIIKIANGRKIVYICDLRFQADANNPNQIYLDMINQQKWGVLMSAEFMLLKFRALFYERTYKEIKCINNNNINILKPYIIFKNNQKKFNNTNNYFLYLKGKFYFQIYSAMASSETRLYVKKIKYYKNHKPADGDKYKFTFISNKSYERRMLYFNLKIRNLKFIYKKSDLLSKYIPGQNISYTSAAEYYIMEKYLLRNNIEPTLENIINKLIIVYTILGKKYDNNLIICTSKNLHKIDDQKQYDDNLAKIKKFIPIYKEQFKNLKEFLKNSNNLSAFLKSYNTFNLSKGIFKINNGNIELK